MDTVTQVALGAVIGEAGFRRRLGGKSVLVGGFCGLLPDLDMVASIAGPWVSLVAHRGSSHSLVVLPFVAAGIGWAAWRWARRRGSPWGWIHLCLWALLTHPILDLCTSYGTQLLAPLQRTRYAIDAVAVIDPLYSLPLFGALALAARKKVSRRFSRRLSAFVLAVTTAYLGQGWLESRRASAFAARQLAAEGFRPEAIRATPTMFNNVLFRVVARNADGDLRVGHLSTIAPAPIDFVSLQHPSDPSIGRALGSPHGHLFSWFADDMVHARIERGDGGTDVLLTDQRYGLITRPAVSFFTARAHFDPAGRLRSVERVDRDVDRSLTEELAAMWDALIGKDRPRPPHAESLPRGTRSLK